MPVLSMVLHQLSLATLGLHALAGIAGIVGTEFGPSRPRYYELCVRLYRHISRRVCCIRICPDICLFAYVLICFYLYVHIYIYIYLHIDIYIYIHIYMYAHTQSSSCLPVFICRFTSTGVFISMCTFVVVCIASLKLSTRVRGELRCQVYICIFPYIYLYVYMRVAALILYSVYIYTYISMLICEHM